jgi:hypothetical protein
LSKRISFVPGALTPEDKGGNRQKEKRGKEEGGYIKEKSRKKGEWWNAYSSFQKSLHCILALLKALLAIFHHPMIDRKTLPEM